MKIIKYGVYLENYKISENFKIVSVLIIFKNYNCIWKLIWKYQFRITESNSKDRNKRINNIKINI